MRSPFLLLVPLLGLLVLTGCGNGDYDQYGYYGGPGYYDDAYAVPAGGWYGSGYYYGDHGYYYDHGRPRAWYRRDHDWDRGDRDFGRRDGGDRDRGRVDRGTFESGSDHHLHAEHHDHTEHHKHHERTNNR